MPTLAKRYTAGVTHPRRTPLDTTARIETPEHIEFRVRLAGPARRGLAYLIDLLIRGAFLVLLTILLSMFDVVSDVSELSTGVMLVVFFSVEWGYYVAFETLWSGQSPGKRALGLRTVKEGGYPITFVDVLLRNLVRAADSLPVGYVVGLSVMAVDSRFRRLGDMVAGTMVVSEERSRLGSSWTISPPPTPGELEALPGHPRLSGPELDAIELFLRRVGRLAPAREEELADLVAPMLAQRLACKYESSARFLALLYFRATNRGVVEATK